MSAIQRLSILVPFAFAAVAVHAADPLIDNQWHGAVAIGGAAASGNTTSSNLNLAADGYKATAADKISLYGLANYGHAKINGTTTATANLFRLGGRYDFNLSEQMFAFGAGEYETNKAAGEDSREGVNAGVGYKMVRTPEASVDLLGGVGYGRVKYTTGESDKGVNLMLGEEGNYKLSSSSTFKQRLMFYPGQHSIGNRATFDAGLSTAISGAWTLNAGLGVRYASLVPAGFKKVDTLATFGFGYKY